MRYPNRIRLLAALVALVSLLFTQVALASYDCPQLADAVNQVMAMQDGQPVHPDCCAPHDKQSPNLCQAHGQSNAQSPDSPAQPPVVPFVAGPLVLELSHVELPLPRHLDAPVAFLQTAYSTPPISIRHCCLRN